MLELILLGGIVGLLSGFFGVGGGTILVPLLLLLGYEIKIAIGISVVQMVFSSIYGSYLNYKKGTLDITMIIVVGIGGFTGGLLRGFITSSVNDEVLEIIFLSFAIFALLRLFMRVNDNHKQKEVAKTFLFIIGFVLGAISMSIGVGGSIILVPILVGFLHVPLKKAVSAGLFFVVFSSLAGLISHTLSEDIDYMSGIIIGSVSLFGVYVGIVLKDKVNEVLQKRLLGSFYFLVVIYLINRIFLEV